ncbi:DUF3139 domain-containing protein [Staphylococcus haemolyticus]|uniref:DUF3139 domain-containing protein n=1 Tax=Staphylococcus haemolyticus TaxID=1283 RepID=UPI001E5E45E0|nr:DUF3139 domain-containing protein [Staphylococcus haemolyticus]MCD9074932.1 DUF3139 domain-containing protein [Staphylococcus haemolyticus]
MSKKQKWIRICIILAISLVVAITFFFAMKTYQGHRNIKMVDSYIEQKHLSDDIKSEKTQYSAKKGVYYKEVVFKDEPHMTYVIQPIGTRKGIFAEGFDTETKKSIKDAKHNYFNQNFKP